MDLKTKQPEVASPGSMHDNGCLGWCTGTTQRDGMGREGGGEDLSNLELNK